MSRRRARALLLATFAEELERRTLLSDVIASATLSPSGQLSDVSSTLPIDINISSSKTAMLALMGPKLVAPAGAYIWRGGNLIFLSEEGSHLMVGTAAGVSTDQVQSELNATSIMDTGGVADEVDSNTLMVDPVDSVSSAAAALTADALPGVAWVVPTFMDDSTGAEFGVGNQAVAQLDSGYKPEDVFTAAGETYTPLLGTPDQYIVTFDATPGVATLNASNALAAVPGVAWAEPNLYDFVQETSTTNDPLLSSQWNLNNTGQTGAMPGADAKVQGAWDTTTGSPTVVTAVVDTGVQLNQPDLAANIWTNPGEIPGNGIDDDGNGYVDDVHGWDFSDNDNDPDPATQYDNHGTAVAGIIAAAGNNSLGVAGVAYNSEVMPVKIFKDTVGNGGGITTDANIAQAVYYAAGRTANGTGTWSSATIQNHSWGGQGPFSTTINDAFTYANSSSRGGKGQPVFAASGNSASAFGRFQLNLGGTAAWQFEWRYVKDASSSAGDDTVWLGYVQAPDGSVERFDSSSLPAGWTTGGNVGWSIVDDPAHAMGVGRYEAKAGTIGDSQTSTIRSPIWTGSNPMLYSVWVSSQSTDQIQLWYSVNGSAFTHVTPFDEGGVNLFNSSLYQPVGAPANLPGNIAVGGSTDWDYRADYAEYGTGLAFVAPTSGGYGGIVTTDRTGTDGYNTSGDYTNTAASAFGGTSAATPLAAGIGALILSKNPNLTAAQVEQVMENSADKIGGVTYVNGFNQYYGYGRLDAAAALALVTAPQSTVIAGQVFEDRNGDGIFNGIDAPLSGVTVFLDTNNDGIMQGGEASAVTSGTGTYTLPVVAGTYHVREVMPANEVGTVPVGGENDVTVSGTVGATQNFGDFPILYTGDANANTYTVRVDPSHSTFLDIVFGATTYSAAKSVIPSLTFNLLGGNDTLTVDYSNGVPLPAGGLFYDGGTGTDALVITGSTGNDAVTLANTFGGGPYGANIYLNDPGSGAQTVENVTFSGNVGNDSLVIGSTVPAVSLVYNGGLTPTDQDSLTLNNGSYAFNSDFGATTANLSLTLNGAGTSATFGASQHLSSLSINNSNVIESTNGSHVINTNALAITGTGKLDLRDNDMVVRSGAVGVWNGTAYTGITGLVQQGRSGGTWTGNGIVTSMTAATAARGKTTLGVATASSALGIASGATAAWGTETVAGTSVLVKYTYVADANLNGLVNGDDYFKIDTGFAAHTTGFVNGDFDYNGVINADDYFLIDQTYVSQGTPL